MSMPASTQSTPPQASTPRYERCFEVQCRRRLDFVTKLKQPKHLTTIGRMQRVAALTSPEAVVGSGRTAVVRRLRLGMLWLGLDGLLSGVTKVSARHRVDSRLVWPTPSLDHVALSPGVLATGPLQAEPIFSRDVPSSRAEGRARPGRAVRRRCLTDGPPGPAHDGVGCRSRLPVVKQCTPDPADEPRAKDQEGLTASWRSGP
jgi:hypothetical protein